MTSKNISVDLWSVDNIKPYEKNAKIHSAEQIDKLVRSIKEFGFTQPIVVDKDGVVIAGHGRRLAAIKMGLKRVPVVVRDDLDEEQVKGLRLADNRVASNEYDTELLQLELTDLSFGDFDMLNLGFDQKELDFLTADLGKMDATIFVEDLSRDVAKHVSDNEKKMSAADGEKVAVSKAFGFKHVTTEQEREIFRFMAQVEADTGLTGPDALVYFIKEVLK